MTIGAEIGVGEPLIDSVSSMDLLRSPLLTDLYQLNMVQAYLEHGVTETATFEFFVRELPGHRRFLVAAGLEQALEFLESLAFSADDLDWLKSSGRFSQGLIEYLAGLRFTGDVHAMPEGRVVFADEPILRVTAPIPLAQLVESRLINILHYQMLVAAKAARHVLIARDKVLVDFGFRRSHGAEAGLMAARASYIAGYAGTATVLADKAFGIPIYGTMAHSFIEAFDDEVAAFEAFAQARPNDLILLLDTYDTEAAAHKVVAMAPGLAAKGLTLRGVRLDSGDLIALANRVRAILDDGGLKHVVIFASGGIDDEELQAMVSAEAPIDGFGIGTSLTTSFDLPALDCVYKLQEYAGVGRRKHATGKATWPGRKQVWRRYDADGRMAGDVLSLDADDHDGDPLLSRVMKDGLRVGPAEQLTEIRNRAARDLARLPVALHRLDPAASYPVDVAQKLKRYTDDVDQRLAGRRRTA